MRSVVDLMWAGAAALNRLGSERASDNFHLDDAQLRMHDYPRVVVGLSSVRAVR
jgi:hypothetical protein